MKRIPKYTAGMFKKKMPRFGASAIKKPRMPKPSKPKAKKPSKRKVKFLQEGGSTDDLVPRSMLPDRNAAQQKKDMDTLMKYYMSDEVRERDKRRAKKDKEDADAAIRETIRNPPYKGMGQRLQDLPKGGEYVLEEQIVTPESSREELKRSQSKNRRRYNVGGKIDGIAKRGRTRGRII